jgi:peroxiredoxin
MSRTSSELATTRKVVRIVAVVALFAATFVHDDADADSSSRLLHELRGEPLSQQAPRFAVIDVDGTTFSLAEQMGHPIVLHFWATWCEPCRRELPALAAAYRRLDDGDVRFIAISIDRDVSAEAIRALVNQYDLPFAVALASSGDVSERYWSWGIPVTYFIDRDGNLRERFLGSRDWASARAQQLLAEFADSAAAH